MAPGLRHHDSGSLSPGAVQPLCSACNAILRKRPHATPRLHPMRVCRACPHARPHLPRLACFWRARDRVHTARQRHPPPSTIHSTCNAYIIMARRSGCTERGVTPPSPPLLPPRHYRYVQTAVPCPPACLPFRAHNRVCTTLCTHTKQKELCSQDHGARRGARGRHGAAAPLLPSLLRSVRDFRPHVKHSRGAVGRCQRPPISFQPSTHFVGG